MMDAALQLFRFASTECGTNSGVLPNLYKGLGCNAANNNTPQFNGLSDIMLVVANVVQILISIAGSLAVITLLVASVYYITAIGDPSRTKRAKEIIQNTIAGLVIIILAYSVVAFVASQL